MLILFSSYFVYHWFGNCFLFPWAISLGTIGVFGFTSMMIFLFIHCKFIYEWKKGFRLGIKMNFAEKQTIPDEFKELAKDFSERVLLLRLIILLIGLGLDHALDDFWISLLRSWSDANINAKIRFRKIWCCTKSFTDSRCYDCCWNLTIKWLQL